MSEGIIQTKFKKYIQDIHTRGGEFEDEDAGYAEQLQADIIAEIEKLRQEYRNDIGCLDCFDEGVESFYKFLIGQGTPQKEERS